MTCSKLRIDLLFNICILAQLQIPLLNASQSITFNDRAYTYTEAVRAIDGGLHMSWDSNSKGCAVICCNSSSSPVEEWWKAEMALTYHITKIRMHLRTGPTYNVTTYTSMDGIQWKICAFLGNLMGVNFGTWIESNCPKNSKGRFIKIANRDKGTFSLCEVEAIGYLERKYHFYSFCISDLHFLPEYKIHSQREKDLKWRKT